MSIKIPSDKFDLENLSVINLKDNHSIIKNNKNITNNSKLISSKIDKKKYFPRRSFTTRRFIKDIASILKDTKALKATFKEQRVSHSFAERIMLAVTAVNGCRYCAWGHTLAALESGMEPNEIKNILDSKFDNAPEDEIVALTFAQHWADKKGKPDRDALKRLIQYYGVEKSRAIITQIRMIMMGNLTGNAVDAFESRLRGKPSIDGTAWFEFLTYFFGGFLFKKIMEISEKKRKKKK